MHAYAETRPTGPKSRSAAERTPPSKDRRRTTPVQLAAANRTGLPDSLKAGVESLSGQSLDHVRVHRNSQKPAQLNAHAYAQGSEIHVAPGQEKHLPHEAWHAAQQAQGRVKATTQLRSTAVNDDPGLEREADVMGRQAAQMRTAAPAPARKQSTGPVATPVLQPFWVREAGLEPAWKPDTHNIAAWYERAQVAQQRREKAGKKTNRVKTVTYYTDESKFSVSPYPSNLGSLPVYQPRAAIVPRLVQLNAWITQWGAPKARHVFALFDMNLNADYALVNKQAADLQAMNGTVVDHLMQRTKGVVVAFLTLVNAGQLRVFFQASPARQQTLVSTDAELQSLTRLARSERAFSQAVALPMNPTSFQGAHYVHEHGAHNSALETIRLAVRYNLRGAGGATIKGNWFSNQAAELALQWATTEAGNEIAAASAHVLPGPSLAHLATTRLPGHAPLFDAAATPIGNAVTRVLTAPVNYEHGTISGAAGNATALIRGDFQPEVGAAVVGAYAGNFTGRLTGAGAGAALAHNAAANNQPLRILNVEGNGHAQVAVTGQTQATGEIHGQMDGPVTANNAHVSFRTGAGPTTRYFNGTGNYHGMVSAAIQGANTTWQRTNRLATVTGVVRNQVLDDGCHNTVSLREITMQAANPGAGGVGVNLAGALPAYTPRATHEINQAGASKAQNLQADLVNHTGGAANFQPSSMQAILANALITGKRSTYQRNGAGPTPVFSERLLDTTLTLNGTRAQLIGLGLPAAVADLSSLNLEVDRVTPYGYLSYLSKDIAKVATPVAGTFYNINLDGQWYNFRLVHYSAAPAQTNFRVLLHLKNQNAAAYEPFTAYPRP